MPSKIGKIPVELSQGVTATVAQGVVTVVGPKGQQQFVIPKGIAVSVSDGKVEVSETDTQLDTSALFGLTRAQIANMVKGVSVGFEKQLELSGVGYRAQAGGSDLTISVGFSHPVKIKALPGISFSVSENVITISGSDKKLVGDMAAKIRSIRRPDPYKAKGISYKGERIRRKAGKAAKAAGAK